MSADLIGWAGTVVEMEKRYADQLRRRFADALQGKRLIRLDIPDRYTLMQPWLIASLRAKASRWRT